MYINVFRLASSSNDCTIRIWSCIDFKCLQTFYGHGDGVLSVRFVSDCENLISCSKDLTMRLWKTQTGLEFKKYFLLLK
jgi:WD40 repeat protein